MDSHDLTPDQLHALTERLRPTLAYLNRLLRRMEAEGFRSQDKLLRTASEAEDRLQHLLTVLHYLGQTEVTGRRVWCICPYDSEKLTVVTRRRVTLI